MFQTRNARRFRAVIVALAISFAANLAISYAAKASGVTTPGPVIKPSIERSGVTTPGPVIKP